MNPGRDDELSIEPEAILNKSVIKIIMVAVVVAGIIGLDWLFDLSAYFSQDNLLNILERAGNAVPIVFMLIMSTAVVISPVPSLPLYIAAGVFFGAFWGTLYAAVGALIGAVVSFYIARSLGRKMMEKLSVGHILVWRRCTNSLMTKFVFFSRLVPTVSFDVVSYGAGLTRMSVFHFSWATFPGMLPLTFVYTYFGSVVLMN